MQIQGKPIIQQRILPSPAVAIDAPHIPDQSTTPPGDENSNIIFRPWKTFGPFVDTIQVYDYDTLRVGSESLSGNL